MLRQQCLELIVELEAKLDFEDEIGSENAETNNTTSKKVSSIINAIDSALETSRKNSIVHDDYIVAILGRPNAGKSSLINAIIGSDKFIVTPTPGTTRDVNEVREIAMACSCDFAYTFD